MFNSQGSCWKDRVPADVRPGTRMVPYFDAGLEAEPWTIRSLSTLKAPGAELACMPAMAESVELLTTP